MMPKFIFTLLFLIFSSFLTAQIANESVVTGALVHDYRGLELAAKGHLLTAKQEFDKALAFMPWFDRSLLNQQICNDVTNGKIDKAFAVSLFHTLNYLSTTDSLQSLSLAGNLLTNHETYAPGYLFRARIYLALKRPQQALADYKAALALAPSGKLAYFFRGKLYAGQKKYDPAANDFSQVIALDPAFAQAYLERGDIYTQQAKYDAAAADYEIALKAWPEWRKQFKVFAAYLNRGTANIHAGKNREALADLDKAIACNPKITEAYFNRGLVYQNLNLLKHAIADFDAVVSAEPQNIAAYFNRGFSRQKQRDYDAAVKDYLKVVKLDSNHVNAYFRLGEIYSKQRDFEQVIPAFAKVIQLAPEKYHAYYWQALAYDRLKMYGKAITAYSAFLEKAGGEDKHRMEFSRERVERLTKHITKK